MGPSVKQCLDPPPERMHWCACQQEDWAAEAEEAASGQAVATGNYPALSGHARPQAFEAFARQALEVEGRHYSPSEQEIVARLRALCHAGDWQGALSLETPALAVVRNLQNSWPEVSILFACLMSMDSAAPLLGGSASQVQGSGHPTPPQWPLEALSGRSGSQVISDHPICSSSLCSSFRFLTHRLTAILYLEGCCGCSARSRDGVPASLDVRGGHGDPATCR